MSRLISFFSLAKFYLRKRLSSVALILFGCRRLYPLLVRVSLLRQKGRSMHPSFLHHHHHLLLHLGACCCRQCQRLLAHLFLLSFSPASPSAAWVALATECKQDSTHLHGTHTHIVCKWEEEEERGKEKSQSSRRMENNRLCWTLRWLMAVPLAVSVLSDSPKLCLLMLKLFN